MARRRARGSRSKGAEGRTQSRSTYLTRPDLSTIQAALRTPQGSGLRHDLWTEQKEIKKNALRDLPEEIASLTTLIKSVNSLALLGALHGLDSVRRSNLPGDANFGSDAVLELLSGLVASLPEADLVLHLDEAIGAETLFAADAKLRRIANLKAQSDFFGFPETEPSREDTVLELLRMEHTFDRMGGFDTHLHDVAIEVFGPIDDVARKEVGFGFLDSLRFADLYGRSRSQNAAEADAWLNEHYPPFDPRFSQDERQRWMAGHMAFFSIGSAPPLELEGSEPIAEALDLSVDSFRDLVRSMSTTIGTTSVIDLNSENPTRVRPILSLSSGEWIWFRPVDFIHEVFQWALSVSSASSKLRRSYDRRRQVVAEQYPATLLQRVFGERVYANLSYPATESDAEIDALVKLPNANLLVECKGGRFSPEGRRAAPLRVARHAQELVTKAADQNQRAARAIADSKPFTDANNRRIHIAPSAESISIVVTFDRIDPFSARLGEPSDGDTAFRSWVIALPDLIMLTEILPTPAEFFAYAKRRSQMLREEQILVFVESDALGAWCEDRLTTVTRVPTGPESQLAIRGIVSETSMWMNEYFTLQGLLRMGMKDEESSDWVRGVREPKAAKRPAADIPNIVASSLDRLLNGEHESWSLRVSQAFSVLPKEWKAFDRVLAAASGSVTTRSRRRKAERASSGYLVGGKLPVRFVAMADDADPAHLALPIDHG